MFDRESEIAGRAGSEPGHTSKAGGTGFGLTVVETIADAHGWMVVVTEGEEGASGSR